MKKTILSTIVLAGIILLSACGNSSKKNQNGKAKQESISILGAGSSFGYPIYSKIFSEYHQQTGAKVNYQSIGSSGGIRQLIRKKVDFGATDKFLTDEEMKEIDKPIVHIPTCIGAIVVAYHLPGNPEIKLSPEVLSNIYLGNIAQWDDPKIKKLNPNVDLPSRKIVVVHRSDGSGTSFNYTLYLSRISKPWKSAVGAGAAVDWPTGVGGKGNEGVAGIINQTPGSIGYVEMVYALQTGLNYATLENVSGNFIKADLASTRKSANIDIPSDSRIYILNSKAPQAYPIGSFTWIILYKEQHYNGRSKAQATQLVKALWWLTHEGQQYCKALNYVRLPEPAVKIAEKALLSVTYDGKPILPEAPVENNQK